MLYTTIIPLPMKATAQQQLHNTSRSSEWSSWAKIGMDCSTWKVKVHWWHGNKQALQQHTVLTTQQYHDWCKSVGNRNVSTASFFPPTWRWQQHDTSGLFLVTIHLPVWPVMICFRDIRTLLSSLKSNYCRISLCKASSCIENTSSLLRFTYYYY